MIAVLKGIVTSIHEQSIVLQTEQIGFEVFVPNASFFTLNQKLELHIHFHWNQENGPSFFGFKTTQEKSVFQLIIKCPGIGPKIALAALEHLGASSFVQAVAAEDVTALSSISGIGKKKAEQMVVQLKHQVAKLLDKGIQFGQDTTVVELQKVSEVLNSLNYSRSEINTTLEYLRKNEQKNVSFDLMLRKALSYLSKRA